ncbi:hypothetical protein F01_100031 [Burkholderia cenocepacia]|nr:hypothetical protein F01_100031 [Burkholderia cenocepacia]
MESGAFPPMKKTYRKSRVPFHGLSSGHRLSYTIASTHYAAQFTGTKHTPTPLFMEQPSKVNTLRY